MRAALAARSLSEQAGTPGAALMAQGVKPFTWQETFTMVTTWIHQAANAVPIAAVSIANPTKNSSAFILRCDSNGELCFRPLEARYGAGYPTLGIQHVAVMTVIGQHVRITVDRVPVFERDLTQPVQHQDAATQGPLGVRTAVWPRVLSDIESTRVGILLLAVGGGNLLASLFWWWSHEGGTSGRGSSPQCGLIGVANAGRHNHRRGGTADDQQVADTVRAIDRIQRPVGDSPHHDTCRDQCEDLHSRWRAPRRRISRAGAGVCGGRSLASGPPSRNRLQRQVRQPVLVGAVSCAGMARSTRSRAHRQNCGVNAVGVS